MAAIEPCGIPGGALLLRYQDGEGYADCFVTEVEGNVSQAQFIEAFYTTRLFKVERAILKWFASRPSTDLDAKALAGGRASTFAAWRVEDRSADQLLLADFTGRTRSWLMAVPAGGRTRLHFGSAVTPITDARTGRAAMGAGFRLLLGFHKLYSRLLLRSARSKILSNDPKA